MNRSGSAMAAVAPVTARLVGWWTSSLVAVPVLPVLPVLLLVLVPAVLPSGLGAALAALVRGGGR